MREAITPSAAWFEPLPDDLPWAFQLHVVGGGFAHRAMPLTAVVGDVEVDQLMVNSDGTGFTGLLAEAPPEGAVLSVGWVDGPLIETGIVFHAGDNV